MTQKSRPHLVQLAVVAATILLSVWGLHRAVTLGDTTVLDETQVIGQVDWFLAGRFELFRHAGADDPAGAMFPGYQFALFSLAAIFQVPADAVLLRMLSFLFSVLYFGAAYRVARTQSTQTPWIRACQCFVLPLVFPFHFLVYTDVFSLLWNVLALGFVLRGRSLLAGLCMACAVASRQDNVMTIGFLFVLAYLLDNHGVFSVVRLWEHCKRNWLMILVTVVLGGFVLWHGRIGLDAPNQQPLTASVGNLAFVLTFAGGLLLPLHLVNAGRVWRWGKSNPLAILIVLGVALAVALSFTPGHRWNSNEGMLRNMLIQTVTVNNSMRVCWGIGMAAVAISLWTTPLEYHTRGSDAALPINQEVNLFWDSQNTGRLVFGYWVIRLVPVLLIDPRYYMIPLVFFLLTRRSASLKVEVALWGYFAVVSVILLYGITDQRFML